MNTITIGEAVDLILPFSNSILVQTRGIFPWLSATITNEAACAKLFIAVKQVGEHIFSAAVTDDMFNGNRLLPTDTSDVPFIKEKHYFGGSSDVDGTNDMNIDQLRVWLFKTLKAYGITKFDPADWKTRMVSLGFNSMKIKKTIDRSVKELKMGMGTILDLINTVSIRGNKFPLYGLEDKEIRCVYAKLKNLGLNPTIVNNEIVSIDYERR